MKIILADDHPIIHKGLEYFIKESISNIEIRSAYNSDEVFKFLEQESFDLIILDVNFPSIDSFDLVKSIKRNFPDTKILIFTQHQEDHLVVKYIKNDVDGFLEKSVDYSKVVEAIQLIAQGRKHFSQHAYSLLLNDVNNPSDDIMRKLSAREKEIAELIANGMGVKEMASKLHLSTSSVGTYKGRIFEKLNVSNEIELYKLLKNY